MKTIVRKKQTAVSADTFSGIMPAEWEPHAATWLAWPHNQEDWPGKFEPIPWVFADIVRHLAEVELVHIIIASDPERRRARQILKRSGVELSQVRFHRLPTDRIWTRDSGAIFTRTPVDGGLVALSWKFNGWAKYGNYHRDARVPHLMSQVAGVPCLEPVTRAGGALRRLVLEGGSIDVDGRGLLLTTRECLLSRVQARNPGITQDAMEGIFARYLGARKVLWLESGIAGDDTHGHIDDTARFVAPGAVLACYEENTRDENFRRLKKNYELLSAMTDLDGRPLKVLKLPMPQPVYFNGQRLPASYANFYIANNKVLVPVFNDSADRDALNIIAECFPGRAVVPIACRDMVWGLGTLHCMTQQQPA
ncbi:MAG: agmatine deiminase family protein [Phycisphaerae bacterium]